MSNTAKGSRGAQLAPNGEYMSNIKARQEYEKKIKQVKVRVSASGKEQLDEYAKAHNISVNELILSLLEEKTGIYLHLH